MTSDASAVGKALAEVARRGESYVADLLDYVKIPSVSTEPHHAADIQAAARWTVERLKRAGVPDVRTLETAGHPVVMGRLHHDTSKPTVIIYGHYDVQPAEPLELWDSPPFSPEVRDGKIYGRGSCDDKAGVLTAIQAVQAFTDTGEMPPVNVTFLIEGEEEIGSPNLAPVLRRHADLLQADLAICADGGIFGVGIPSVTVGSRGLAGAELVVEGASTDLHSGTYGGAVANPIAALARIIASFHDDRGRVVVEGFEDGVSALSADVRRAVGEQPVDERAELDKLGLDSWWGDPDYTAGERRAVRPTLEVNGIGGGYQGPGVKTVLPNRAKAKVTCRLVVGQDPEAVLAALRRHVEMHTPPGVKATLTPLPGSGRAYQMPLDHPALDVASDAMEAVFGRSPFPVWTGGTVPVAEQF
ncbi:MAG TPA: dipeptidase, partial [Trueperaceae bacterium]